ncbi:InlB B-repeat-containing protein, partial [Candidatus Vampirococcus lugosii]
MSVLFLVVIFTTSFFVGFGPILSKFNSSQNINIYETIIDTFQNRHISSSNVGSAYVMGGVIFVDLEGGGTLSKIKDIEYLYLDTSYNIGSKGGSNMNVSMPVFLLSEDDMNNSNTFYTGLDEKFEKIEFGTGDGEYSNLSIQGNNQFIYSGNSYYDFGGINDGNGGNKKLNLYIGNIYTYCFLSKANYLQYSGMYLPDYKESGVYIDKKLEDNITSLNNSYGSGYDFGNDFQLYSTGGINYGDMNISGYNTGTIYSINDIDLNVFTGNNINNFYIFAGGNINIKDLIVGDNTNLHIFAGGDINIDNLYKDANAKIYEYNENPGICVLSDIDQCKDIKDFPSVGFDSINIYDFSHPDAECSFDIAVGKDPNIDNYPSIKQNPKLGVYYLRGQNYGYMPNNTDYNVYITKQGSGYISGYMNSKYASGANITLTANPDSGWKFNSWSGDECDGSTDVECNFTMPSNDVNITANFEQEEADYYTIFFDEINGLDMSQINIQIDSKGTISGDQTIDLINGTYNYTASASGYTTKTGTFTVSGADQTVNIELDPEVITSKLTITIDCQNPNDEIEIEGFSNCQCDSNNIDKICEYNINSGDTVILTQLFQPLHKFNSWSGNECNGSTNDECNFTMPSNNVNITANSEEVITYEIKFDLIPTGAQVEVDGITYTNGGMGNYEDGSYEYTASASGYTTKTGTFTVSGADQTVNIELDPEVITLAGLKHKIYFLSCISNSDNACLSNKDCCIFLLFSAFFFNS